MKRWVTNHIFPVGLILALVVVACCFLVNMGGAWWGDRANVWEFLMTIFYMGFWAVFTIASMKYTQLSKVVFLFSLLTLISSVCALFFHIKHGFIIAAVVSSFAAVPFYGFRFFLNWTAVYVIAVVVAAVWFVVVWWNIRKIKQ